MNRIETVKIKGITGSFSKEESNRKAKNKILNQKIAQQKDDLSSVFKRLQIGNLAEVRDIRLVSLIHNILPEDDIDTLINILNVIVG